MKLVIKRESFLKAFSRAAIAAPARSHKEILTNVLLTANNGDSSLAATDLEIATRVWLGPDEIEIDECGSVLLPAATFYSILRESSDESLRLALDNKLNLIVNGQRTRHRLQTMRAEEFPAVDPGKKSQPLTLPAPLLAYAMKAIEPMTGEETRYALSCVLFHVTKTGVAFIGTEGHMAGVLEHQCSTVKESESLLPQKGAKALGRLMADQSGDVELWTTDNWLRFRSADLLFMSRLGEGRFPRWRDFVPTGQKIVASLPCGPLKAAIRQASLTGQAPSALDTNNAKFTLSDGQLAVSTLSETGDSLAEIPVSYEGPEFSIGLDWRLTSLCLGAFTDDAEVAIKFVDTSTAAVIERENVTFVIMPTKL